MLQNHTQGLASNLQWLQQAGVKVLHPDEGAMACGEFGYGRLPEPEVIWSEIAGHFGIEVEVPEKAEPVALEAAVEEEILEKEAEAEVEAIEPEVAPRGDEFDGVPAMPADIEVAEEDALGGGAFKVKKGHQPLKGKHMLITAGPTWEAIDPVRYIANRSSGKQGFAIAAAAAALGAKVTLVAGPVSLRTPDGVDRVDVESAVQMLDAVKKALPADIAVMVAAVADWRPKESRGEKMKKRGSAPPALVLEENPDILTNVAAGENRPKLVVGFAAETEDVLDNAKRKRKRKAADWIVANDVSGDVMGGDMNRVQIISEDGVDTLEEMPKMDIAMALVEKMAETLQGEKEDA